MKIETKFDIGQKVWISAFGYRVAEVTIKRIEIFANYAGEDSVIYYLGDFDIQYAHEFELSNTREEAEAKLKEIENGIL